MMILNAHQTGIAEIEMTKRGISLLQLMENAGTGAAKKILQDVDVKGKRVAVICGKGNNGGDGYVIARVLKSNGAQVSVLLCMGEPTTDDAKAMFDIIGDIEKVDFRFLPDRFFEKTADADIIVDCIFGIGFKGTPREPIDRIIDSINQSKATVYSIDLPSGQACDTGRMGEHTVNPDKTLTFTTLKPCHKIYPSALNCGKTAVIDVGIDSDICKNNCNMNTIETDIVMAKIPKRFANSNKGSYGRLLTVCSSYNMPGACVLSASSAARCGVGLIQCALPHSILPIVASKVTEAIFLPLSQNEQGRINADAKTGIIDKANRPTACLIGCGLGLDDDIRRLTADLLFYLSVPVILDADGINAIIENKNILKQRCKGTVLTPHPGEMARLCGTSIEEIQSSRLEYAVSFAKEYGVVLVLKGADTIVTDGEAVYINTSGNAGMAKAGSGDVLSGMIGSFLAQGLSPLDAAVCGVHLHGIAGDYAAKRFSRIAMQPSDMVNMLGEIFLDNHY